MKAVAVPADGFKRIAILRLSSLGDIVLTLPIVRALRTAFPEAQVSFWLKEEFADLVRFDPAIDHVRLLERDARRIEDLVSMSAELEDCDLIVDLHGNARTRVLTLRQRAPVLRAASHRLLRARWVHARWSAPAPVPHALDRYATAIAPLGLVPAARSQMTAGAEAEGWANEVIGARSAQGRTVAFCPGARHATKRWPESHWVQLFDQVRAADRPVACFSIPAEREALPELARRVAADPSAIWCTEPIARMAALLSHCACAVTCDSGLMHLAAARGARVVALFGSTSPALGFAPLGEGHAVLCRNEPCQPCTLHGREACPQGHFRCMRALTPDDVAAHLALTRG